MKVEGDGLHMYDSISNAENTFKYLDDYKPKNCYNFPLCEIICAYALHIYFFCNKDIVLL